MAKTINDALLSLTYRLGETTIPSSTTEVNKRVDWMREAIDKVTGGEQLYWFLQKKHTDTTVADQGDYSMPTRWRNIIEVKVDDYKYSEIPYEEVYEKYEVPSSPVPILPSYLDRSWYYYNDSCNLIPIPAAAPTTYTVSSLTESSGTATATTSEAHGYKRNMVVTIAGADQSDYNGSQTILTVPSTTTFTFAVSNSPTSPATGTITSVRQNIEIKYYENSDTSAITTASSIVVPDNFMDLLVSYAEGRYWSSALKRAKASDAFIEFETLQAKLKEEQFRKQFIGK